MRSEVGLSSFSLTSISPSASFTVMEDLSKESFGLAGGTSSLQEDKRRQNADSVKMDMTRSVLYVFILKVFQTINLLDSY